MSGAPPRRLTRVAGRLLALSLVASTALGVSAPAARAAEPCSTGGALTVVAHPDDDLLFLNPDVLTDVRAGRCAATLYVSAADAGQPDWYWQMRERGVMAAYATMAGVADAWATDTVELAGRPVTVRTLEARPTVRLAFLRLPDGMLDGSGSDRFTRASLEKLYDGSLASLTAVDGSATYTRAQLVATIAAAMSAVAPDVVRTQDHVGAFGDGDNSDHHAAARLTAEAHARAAAGTPLRGYVGYATQAMPVNVSGTALQAKTDALLAYAAWDGKMCDTAQYCATRVEGAWLQRQHVVDAAPPVPAHSPTPTPSPTPSPSPSPSPSVPVDVTGGAVVSASSQNPADGQTAAKAVDGVLGGWPGDHTAEWATQGGRAGSWLDLAWAQPVTLGRVVLHDRPNAADRVTSATLTFSDGTSVAVPALADDGSAVEVAFPARATTSLRVTLTGVSGTTVNAGLSDLRTWSSGTPSPPPTPTPSPVLPVDVTGGAVVSASSQNPADGQTAAKAVDGVLGGWPGDHTAEWATQGGRAGSWLDLAWAQPVSVGRVVLHDRPNAADRVTSATLTFSDGTSVAVPALADDGSAVEVAFPARSTTSLRVTLTGVSGTTVNAGLSELRTWSA